MYKYVINETRMNIMSNHKSETKLPLLPESTSNYKKMTNEIYDFFNNFLMDSSIILFSQTICKCLMFSKENSLQIILFFVMKIRNECMLLIIKIIFAIVSSF